MNQKTLYLLYGFSILTLGLVGFYLTHAKSALISGAASASIIILLSFFICKSKVVLIATRVVNVLLIGAFAWRSTLAMTALTAGNGDKLIPAILISVMALVSVAAFGISLLSPKYPTEG
ncbi:MAG: hypothetical protein O3C63_05440 [Cyanobacteria bacterium]|nr:hypothetical protein [Cyanobacteriota bacterium]MDA1021083.1 hypothetical protein [Cyanobacteriota bacterium]